MPTTETCPTLSDYNQDAQCMEQLAGTGSTAYLFIKSDLSAALTRELNTYSTPAFASGKGLYKVECKEQAQQIQGESLGRRKGFKQTFNFVLDAVNPETAKLSRAINNLNVGIIVKDGDNSQIMYSPDRNITIDSGGIKSDTGTKAEDDRQTSFAIALSPVPYANMYVTEPTSGGWDGLLASKTTTP